MYKVFIVDDEELVIKSLKATVDWKYYGFEVIGYALSGEEAFEIIMDCKPDVIFTDIRMPGISGLELIKKVKDTGLSTKFLVVSGIAEFALAQKAIHYGVFGYCLKPFDDLEIVNYLKKIKKELDSQSQFVDEEILDLIESSNSEDIVKLKQEFTKAAVLRDKTSRAVVFLTVGREKLKIESTIPVISLHIGYRKYIYIINEGDKHLLLRDIPMIHEGLKGIGQSEPFTEIQELRNAIAEAEINAYQYFITGNPKDAVVKLNNLMDKKAPKLMLTTPIDVPQLNTEINSLILLFKRGQWNIRHALILYNDVISFLSQINQEMNDMYLYSFDQLVDLFEYAEDMLEHIKGLLMEEQISVISEVYATRNRTFLSILSYINDNFSEDISLQHIAREFSLNANYISQLFKKELGKTFTEHLSGLRMERAGILLRTTLIPINEVAEHVGYKDYFYFSRLFKKTIGISPSRYRSEQFNQ
ncbi:response regulator transcription factor [Paenibacillus donghaensis]|uniref:DNA-binding response regulator n=1 Tax=Paenibacillus donghaensis TaxID=414771 RepID=A0A2Z2KLS6_9BACL|nr:response regulator [Paenibacillus donghaensis]ASA23449.1 hypothetical protein B9T62_23160 [Paenibacillus donghaensis]